MAICSWIGLIGYLLAFLLFFISSILNIINTFGQYKIGKNNGFNYKYKVKDWFLNTPIKAIFSSIIIALGGFYVSLVYLIPIIMKYWNCLSIGA